MRRGFTLLEVIIAIALLLALVGAMTSFLFGLFGTRRTIMAESRQAITAAILVDRLEQDLMTCLVGDRVFGAGVTGDDRRLSVLTRAVPAAAAQRGDEDPAVVTDLERVEYRFDPERFTLSAARTILTRADVVVASPEPLPGFFGSVRFRYHDGEDWQDRFDSRAADHLPVAVEVSIWFTADEAPEVDAVLADDEDELLAPEDDFEEADDESFVDVRTEEDAPAIAPDRRRVIVIPGGRRDAEASDENDEEVSS